MTKCLRFGVVYGAPPVFNPEIDEMGYVDLDDLHLPSKLLARIKKWNDEFQLTFFDDYPPDSGFKTTSDLEQHNSVGAELAELIQKELGSDVLIEFVSTK
jgi:hypothetical protein